LSNVTASDRHNTGFFYRAVRLRPPQQAVGLILGLLNTASAFCFLDMHVSWGGERWSPSGMLLCHFRKITKIIKSNTSTAREFGS